MISRPTFIAVLKALLSFLFSLILLITVNFFILKSLPGNAFDSEVMLHPLVRNELDKSITSLSTLWMDINKYFQFIFSGTLGYSIMKSDRTVLNIIQSGFRETFILNLSALVTIYFLGFFFSLLATIKKNTWIEAGLDQIAVCFISFPALFIGPILIYLFSVKLSVFPMAFLHQPVHFVLPIATLSLRPAAFLYRCLKHDLSIMMQSDFIRFTRAKGLSHWQIVWRHALVNSLDTVINYSSTLIVGTLSGSLLVEIMFSIPGIATEFLFALENRDYPVVSGIVIIFGALLYFLTSAFDLLRVFFDPRQRIQE